MESKLVNAKVAVSSTTVGLASAPGELERLEAIVESARPKPKERALALLEIHDRRLYASEYASFDDYLWERWQIRRSRGYQLLRWARLLMMATGAQPSGPVNERQARRLETQSQEQDRTMRAMAYIIKANDALAPADRLDFIHALRSLLNEMEQELGPAANAQQPVAALVDN